jgi:hypothetical protein
MMPTDDLTIVLIRGKHLIETNQLMVSVQVLSVAHEFVPTDLPSFVDVIHASPLVVFRDPQLTNRIFIDRHTLTIQSHK